MQQNSRNDTNPSDEINDHDKPGTAGSLKHILRTGLPPGITPEEALDPGNNARRKTGETGPADDRS